ncbi:hypothetical protein SPRG_04828 [Saprolegnia parasitica CBS 223.65]|uniref:Uncharacterized protein n=1 Tax=Saprolegnia parasitica (strain CBS 223.65) TaxID=695850 RepID=A0A067CNU7_SAPPC|nr:hypothetical protein SPRG_04828 [Saprolegnia parasitica CBS 223.65]KDO30925.1 hypothetical protein SPRG_04828 [Saprolegnia parasitica CBS 223.65]|eukprot:XP_012198616.1 hypothetical protein SPRG_04828 [Saprolegnia parasitica CBS 223.65]
MYRTFAAVAAHPTETAGTASRLVFGWAKPLLYLGNQRKLSPDDLYPLPSASQVGPLTLHFADVYEHKDGGLLATFFSIYYGRFLCIGLMQCLSVLGDLYGPGYVLGALLRAVAAPVVDMQVVLTLIGSLYLVQLVNAFLKAHLTYMNESLGLEFSSSLRAMLFEKVLRLRAVASSSSVAKEKMAADIANLISTDTINVMGFATSMHSMWIVPLQIAAVLYLLYSNVGWSIFVGLGVVAIILVINAIAAMLMGAEQARCFELKNDRMEVLQQVFAAIQTIKMDVLETQYEAKIKALRGLELASVRTLMRILLVLVSFMNCTLLLVTLVVVATFTLWMQQTLTVTIVFSTLALFKPLQDALVNLPIALMAMVQSLTSVQRINDILLLDEVSAATSVWGPSHPLAAMYANEGVVVAIETGSFAWHATSGPILRNIHLRLRRGELAVLHGAVGQGKSSLVAALLGEMQKLSGSVFVGGQVAYLAQQAWIQVVAQNTTIRENILFGQPYDHIKYEKVLDACALTKEVGAIGDLAEIGLKGVALTCSQKARIALARACYSDADILLLDAPLAALDPSMASEIFTKCILGLLAKKTVLLVTHNMEIIQSPSVRRSLLLQGGRLHEASRDPPKMLRRAVSSVVANKPRTLHRAPSSVIDAKPESSSRPLQRMASSATETKPARTLHRAVSAAVEAKSDMPQRRLHDLLGSPSHQSVRSLQLPETLAPLAEDAPSVTESSRLLLDDDSDDDGNGHVSTAIVGGYVRAMGGCVAVCTILLLTTSLQLLRIGSDLWLTHWAMAPASTLFGYDPMALYAGLALGSCVLVALQTYAVIAFGLRASQHMFGAMLSALLAAPIRFFASTSTDAVCSRCSDDVVACDFSIPFTLGPILFEVSSFLATLLTTLYVTRWPALLVLPLLYLDYKLGAFFLEPLHEVHRLENASRAPLLQAIAEAIDGATTLRAFKETARVEASATLKIEAFGEARAAATALNAWCALRMSLVSSTVVAAFLSGLVALRHQHELSFGLLGLLITYVLAMPANLSYLATMWSQLEAAMRSPERLQEYMAIESEGDATTTLANWPTAGAITFDDVSFQYTSVDPLVLKNVSSLMMALFRMNDVASGSIAIDGVDIATVGLRTLRSHLAIIPQNPVLFKGTLRNYLDPFDEYDDASLWDVLQKVQMVDRVSQHDEKLLGPVDENGENFSVGERQMLCMARALLRQAKVVVLDEVLTVTDHAVDKVLRTEFAASTVLTIAYRCETMLACDRILVLDQGALVHSGSPKALLKQRHELFLELLRDGGYTGKMH